MKLTLFYAFVGFLFFITSCNNTSTSTNSINSDEDTVTINPTQDTAEQSIKVSGISIDTNLLKAQLPVITKQKMYVYRQKNNILKQNALESINQQIVAWDNVIDTSTTAPHLLNCAVPASIRDLKDGISLQAYEFQKGDEAKLSLMGFGNVSLQKDSKITIVEFSQTGSSKCDDKTLSYGIGARLMLEIIKKKKDAKLLTPQQITASVIFGRAEVKYNVITFGITGPKTANLIKSGTLSENTYNDFINAIADIIIDAYKDEAGYIITPQYLPLRQ